MNDEPSLLSPAGAAERLDISTAMLRRHSAVYEDIFGALPRSARGRLYPLEAVERLQKAQDTYHDGFVPSIEAALRLEATGETYPATRAIPEAVARPDSSGLAAALQRIEDMHREHIDEMEARLMGEIQSLRQEVVQLRALPPSQPKETQKDARPLWVRVADFILGRPEAL